MARRRKKLPPGFEENIRKRKKEGFQGKVEGERGRHRPDRKAMQRGGTVRVRGPVRMRGPYQERGRDEHLATDLADAEPINPNRPDAPAGGREAQRYQFGGRVSEHAVRSQYHGGPLRTRTTTVTSRHRDPHPVTGLKKGGEPKKWIGKARASMERRGTVGSLHTALGVPQGEKIGAGRLAAAKSRAQRTGNTKLMRKVVFAQNVSK